MSIDFPKEEEAILERWREINAFQRQVCQPGIIFLAVAHPDKFHS